MEDRDIIFPEENQDLVQCGLCSVTGPKEAFSLCKEHLYLCRVHDDTLHEGEECHCEGSLPESLNCVDCLEEANGHHVCPECDGLLCCACLNKHNC